MSVITMLEAQYKNAKTTPMAMMRWARVDRGGLIWTFVVAIVNTFAAQVQTPDYPHRTSRQPSLSL
jgi:hypothetical protein